MSESKPPDMSPLKCLENKDNDKVIINLKGNLGLFDLVSLFVSVRSPE